MTEILICAQPTEGVLKTRIMFDAYLSFNQLRDYLRKLTESGLIEHIRDDKYRTTTKGMQMLEVLCSINSFVQV